LRLYPPIWVVTRNVVADAELGGYRIPKGEQILLSPFVAQRHPSNWSEPERFDPERFRPESAPRPGDCRYIPFGAGPRVCIGFSFAMMAMTTAIAKLLRSFSLELHSSHVFGFDPGLSLRPRGGIPVLLTARRAG
jgi:cytochrome P450